MYNSIKFFENPFASIIITSNTGNDILFFSQTFAVQNGFHPSVESIPKYFISENFFDITKVSCSLEGYLMLVCNKKPSSSEKIDTNWTTDLIHELRTTSLLIDLGTHVLTENNADYPSILSNRLIKTAHRQKISTLVASDIIQLLTEVHALQPVSLTSVLKNSIVHLERASNIEFHLRNPFQTSRLSYINPIIAVNAHFLTYFFITLLSWLESEQITLELDIRNNISVKTSFIIPHDHFLSSIQGYHLISHYLHYIVAYFNGSFWMTQNSVNIIFPLVITPYPANRNLSYEKDLSNQ